MIFSSCSPPLRLSQVSRTRPPSSAGSKSPKREIFCEIFSPKLTRPRVNHFLHRNKDVQIPLSTNIISFGRAHNTPFHDKRRLHMPCFSFFGTFKFLISRAQAIKVSSGAITRPTSTFCSDPPPSLPISKSLWWKKVYVWSTYQELKATIGGASCWNQWYR